MKKTNIEMGRWAKKGLDGKKEKREERNREERNREE